MWRTVSALVLLAAICYLPSVLMFRYPFNSVNKISMLTEKNPYLKIDMPILFGFYEERYKNIAVSCRRLQRRTGIRCVLTEYQCSHSRNGNRSKLSSTTLSLGNAVTSD